MGRNGRDGTPKTNKAKAGINRLTVLQEKHILFCAEYLVSSDVRAASAAVGISYQSGYRLLHDPLIRAEITRQAELAIRKMDVTPESVIQELAAIGMGDIGDALSWDNNGLHINDSRNLTRAQRAMISKVKCDRFGNITIETRDKVPALSLLARHLGLLQESETAMAEQIRAFFDGVSKLAQLPPVLKDEDA